MANKRKFIDSNHNLCGAGTTTLKANYNVPDILQIEEEAAENIIQAKCMKQQQDLRNKFFCAVTPCLPDDSVYDILSPESKKTRFIRFREKFAENLFFKKTELGKSTALDSKPENFTNENFTYGHPNPISERAYDVVFPKKSMEEINREYSKWHEKYKLSHSHYFPSERIKRSYNDAFNANSTFGRESFADPTGNRMRRLLETCNRLVLINKSQKEFKERTEGPMGISIKRSDVMPPTDFPAKIKIDPCNVHALIEDINPCINNQSLISSLAHIHLLRRKLFNRINFHMFDLKSALHQYDKESTGYLTFTDTLKALRSLTIRAEEDKLRQAISYYKIFENEGQPNEKVNLDLFWKMLHIQYPLSCHGNLAVTPGNFLNKDTTYRSFCQDRNKPLPIPPPLKMRKPELIEADRTRAGDLITPDIPMRHGLSPNDMEMLRSKDELKRIYNNILGENFDKIWENVRAKLKGNENCKISVNQMRDFMTS